MSAFDAIIGYGDVKDRLRRIADSLHYGDEYRRLGARPSKGLLLYGPPGVGKSLMARCLIEESGREAYTIRKNADGKELIGTIRDAFDKAAQQGSSIVFLDDLDKFSNGDDRCRDEPEYVTVQSCIDELRDSDIFVLATANDIHKLPRSLLRQGRLGNKIKVQCPKDEDAEKIVAHYLGMKPCIEDVDVELLGRVLSGHSCAELEEVVNEAAIIAGYRRAGRVSTDDLLHAVLTLLFDVDERANKEGPRLDALHYQDIAYHEAGHVVVSEAIDSGSVTLASMLSRRGDKNGFTMGKRLSAMNVYEAYEARILISLAGWASSEQILGIVDMGSGADMRSAREDVEHLVRSTGCYGALLCRERYESSDALDSNVEIVVAAELNRYFTKAKEILAKNSDLVIAVANRLLERRIITMRDIAELKRERPVVPARL